MILVWFSIAVLLSVSMLSLPYIFADYNYLIIMKNLDPLRAKKIFIRKKLDHTAVSAIKASSVTL